MQKAEQTPSQETHSTLYLLRLVQYCLNPTASGGGRHFTREGVSR